MKNLRTALLGSTLALSMASFGAGAALAGDAPTQLYWGDTHLHTS
jgi:Spy/CpxP family protein refolding chaperone